MPGHLVTRVLNCESYWLLGWDSVGAGEIRAWALAPQGEQERHKREQRHRLPRVGHDCFEAKFPKQRI